MRAHVGSPSPGQQVDPQWLHSRLDELAEVPGRGPVVFGEVARRCSPSGSLSSSPIRSPIRRIRSPSCARAASGHAATEPPSSELAPNSFDRVVGAGEHGCRQIEAERLCRLKINRSWYLVAACTGRSAGFRP
jgi:hypothetical protein